MLSLLNNEILIFNQSGVEKVYIGVATLGTEVNMSLYFTKTMRQTRQKSVSNQIQALFTHLILAVFHLVVYWFFIAVSIVSLSVEEIVIPLIIPLSLPLFLSSSPPSLSFLLFFPLFPSTPLFSFFLPLFSSHLPSSLLLSFAVELIWYTYGNYIHVIQKLKLER